MKKATPVVGLRRSRDNSKPQSGEMTSMMKLRPITKAVLRAFPSCLAIGAASIASAQQTQPSPKADSAIIYVNNVTDEKALLSFDRERGVAHGSDSRPSSLAPSA
jgi:hypothetical protein